VGIIDTGIDSDHPDLAVNYKGGYDFFHLRASPEDDNGHGTLVAGIIAARSNGVVVGVAPEAWLYAIKACDSAGNCQPSDVVAGVNWARNHGIQVLNLSLGYCEPHADVNATLDSAYAEGIVIVASVGNGILVNPHPCGQAVQWPAADTASVIAVDGVRADDTAVMGFSFGPQVEVAAPGWSIASTFPTTLGLASGCTDPGWGVGYAVCDGTSFAAPHVTGTVALILKSGVATTPAQVRARLHFNDTRIDDHLGYGIVDAEKAVTLAPLVSDVSGLSTPVTTAGDYGLTAHLVQGVPPLLVKWDVIYSNGVLPDVHTGYGSATYSLSVPSGFYQITVTATPIDAYGRTPYGGNTRIYQVCTTGGGDLAPALIALVPPLDDMGPNVRFGCTQP